jgi:hypothetical protein
MKFYIDSITTFNFSKIKAHKLNAIYITRFYKLTYFLKNGNYHNIKNAAYINYNGFKEFFLNGKYYGNKYNFTKQSWRRFVKLKAFI